MRVYSDVLPAVAMAAFTVDLTLVAMAAATGVLASLTGVLVTTRGVVVVLVPPLAVVAVVAPDENRVRVERGHPCGAASLAA